MLLRDLKECNIGDMLAFAHDLVNQSIWAESISLQRKIAKRETTAVGVQQAMPKACDEHLFSAQNPLPWVPDLVGSRFGTDPCSVLVVASSYNGFIEGYSRRDAVMPLHEYVNAKNDDRNGLERFSRAFVECVVDRDAAYYQPILRTLLPAAGCDPDCCCITDLCKASFVRRGSGPDNDKRGDVGSDTVVKENWPHWLPYVTGGPDGGSDAPLPYQWLWQRMQQCRVIIALGAIAEYGVLKILQRMAAAPNAWSWRDNSVRPAMTASVSDWKYGYANTARTLGSWLRDDGWWAMSDSSDKLRWFMLPVYHPAYAIGRGGDSGYRQTAPRVRRMMTEAGKAL